MGRLKEAIDGFFSRQGADGEDASDAYERMTREIKGSIYTLVALFELVALTSYIPIDSFNIFQGRLDHMNNMSGIVGAIVAEWFLGTVGAAGYSIILLTLWLAFDAFRGRTLRDNLARIIGVVLGTLLTAVTCHLVLMERFPEASLMQGGVVGKIAGGFLRSYFNTTGALLLVGGGFVITLILTTGFSLTRLISILFASDEDEEVTSEIPVAKRPVARPIPVAAPAPQKAKRSRKKKTTDEDTPPALDENGEPIPTTDEGDPDADESGDSGPFVFEELIPFTGAYSVPSTRILKDHSGGVKKLSRGQMKDNARKLCEHLLSFQITGDVTSIQTGPVITTYEYKPSAGIKLSKIEALQDDLGVVLGTNQLRIIAPIPGKTVVGIEVPRPEIEAISLKDIIGQKEFHDKKLKLPVALGKSTDGKPLIGDLAAMPHLLVAGSTGSGKSVFVNCLIMSLLFRLTPRELRMILVDPKMLEFAAFEGMPHLITNVITDNNKAFNALSWAVEEMERRYRLMADSNSKNIESYNAKNKGDDKIPLIVVVVDELDLMMSGGEAVEVAITRLAQKARAAGIHLVLATQRPSTDVVTGLIKANIPSRLSFKVPSAIDSRTVLDTGGAESLIGRGDSLMIQPAVPLRRMHGCYVSEEELTRAVNYVKAGKDHSKNYIQFSSTPPPGKGKK